MHITNRTTPIVSLFILLSVITLAFMTTDERYVAAPGIACAVLMLWLWMKLWDRDQKIPLLTLKNRYNLREQVTIMNTFEQEVKSGERFSFGKNWRSFLSNLNEDRINESMKSILTLLELDSLKGKRLLDVGSGSGLFSLSARRLGAKVSSFDYDPDSVACTNYLRSKFFTGDSNWQIQQGSVLDVDFLESLGTFDVVYAWGVLHHTGNMWKALENVVPLVETNGLLCVAIYNDQGRSTKLWRKIKALYCSGTTGKFIVCVTLLPYLFSRAVVASILKRENIFSTYKKNRGMSIVHDWFDWLGGFPYETAKVDDIFRYYRDRGFTLRNIVTPGGSGCNQFVFTKTSACQTDPIKEGMDQQDLE